MKKETLSEMKEKYETMPTSRNVITLAGISYTVVSHYTGTKDVDSVVRTLAEKQAYADISTNANNLKTA